MPDERPHLDPKGSVGQSRPPSPKAIKEEARGRANLTRIKFGGVVLVLLTVAFISAFFFHVEGAFSILAVIGTGLGFLLGGRDKDTSDS